MSDGNAGIREISINIILWMFLPGMVTKVVQKFYYVMAYKAGSLDKPQPGTARYHRTYKIIYITVVGLYLLFCIYQTINSLSPNFYKQFNVSITAMDREIKSQFKKHALRYHPDRLGANESEDEFIRIRKIYEVLNNPVNRESYNKFGEMKQCVNCVVFHDFLWQAFMDYIGFYGGTGLVLVILTVLGHSQYARYWRFVTYLLMACIEACLIVLPYDPTSIVFTNFAVFEKITIMHQCIIYVFMAISQFGPMFSTDEEDNIRSSIQKLEKLTVSNINRIDSQLKSTFDIFIKNPEKLQQLKERMESMSSRTETNEDRGSIQTVKNRHSKKTQKKT